MSAPEKEKDNLSNKALDRTFQLLDAFAIDGLSMNVTEISRFLGVTRITSQAMVNSLEEAHYIEKDPETGRYSFGYKMFALGSRYVHRYPFLLAAEKHVTSYCEQKRIKINVSILKPNGQVIILLSKDISMTPVMSLGKVIPANASASGKVQLAYMDEKRRQTILNNMEYRAFTPSTTTDPAKLKAHLKEIAKQGYAVEIEELVPKQACISAPIFDLSHNIIAAVSFCTNLSRFESEFETLKKDICLLASLISAELGYNEI